MATESDRPADSAVAAAAAAAAYPPAPSHAVSHRAPSWLVSVLWGRVVVSCRRVVPRRGGLHTRRNTGAYLPPRIAVGAVAPHGLSLFVRSGRSGRVGSGRRRQGANRGVRDRWLGRPAPTCHRPPEPEPERYLRLRPGILTARAPAPRVLIGGGLVAV